MRLILASASPRRAELLRAAGYAFETLVVNVDESVRPDERAEDYVKRLARSKSARGVEVVSSVSPNTDAASHVPPASSRVDRYAVLGADTAVVVEGEILGKPADDDDARRMLHRLAGREHQVLTGISLRSTVVELAAVETTAVWFAPLSSQDIDWYVASGEGRDKAGGYAIQGLASRFIPRIAGSYSNVVGLPIARLGELVTEMWYSPQKTT